RSTPPLSPSALTASVEAATSGDVVQFVLPDRPDRSVRMLVAVDGEPRSVYADPYDGAVLGSTPYGGVMYTIRKIHSLQLFGFWASSVVEAVAGWVLVLVVTGVFLWWPRGASGGVVTVRTPATRRTFWRDLHAVTGALSGAVIAFLVITGMPWSMLWGANVQRWVAMRGLGQPAPPARVTPGFLLPAMISGEGGHSHGAAAVEGTTPWAMEHYMPPGSTLPGMAAEPIGVDRAVAEFDRIGLPRPFAVQGPEGPDGAYAAVFTSPQAQDTRSIYLDQYSGEVLADVRYADYGPAAKAIEWGIAVHEGRQYGGVNRLVMLAGCMAILLLATTAPIMWWKRRPKGTLAAPPPPPERRVRLAVLGAVAVAGVIFPLVGATLLIAFIIDFAWTRIGGRRRVAA
ncbi:MAG: PepSY-associated TM helix domain-containing protein, partial [Gemmatimonadales bacterium]